MRHFHCHCGNRVFFDSNRCLACGRSVGFDPTRLQMVSYTDHPGLRRCANTLDFDNCNWLVPELEPHSRCASCRLNEVIPTLARSGNLELWSRVETAKRRLLYSLLKLSLPLAPADGAGGLRFRIMEDHRRNPDVFEDFVATAHLGGVITINILEADDAMRHAAREQMQERYRTVLGHLRHESAHYYFSRLVSTPELLAESRALFGDERANYSEALTAHYASGPAPDWPERFVSAYAAAHPAEDFAETFAHYLHIDDALETARAAGLATDNAAPDPDGGGRWLSEWIELAVTLNDIARSLGADDPYPFVLSAPVREKLRFIDRLVRRPVAPSAA